MSREEVHLEWAELKQIFEDLRMELPLGVVYFLPAQPVGHYIFYPGKVF